VWFGWGKSIAKVTADAVIKSFLEGLLKHGVVIAQIEDIRPERRSAVLDLTRRIVEKE
jgi:hypothetical protein